MANEPMKIKDAESCLQLTLISMRLEKPDDREFLTRAMKSYAQMVLAEFLEGEKRAGA